MNNTAAGRPKQFLVDLAEAMRVTAEAERQATIDQCQANAKAYVESLQSHTSGGSATLQQAAVADISTLRNRSKARMEKTRQEAEERIARRYELLEQDLQEYAAAIESEIGRVQDHVQAFEAALARSFEQLMETSDPSEFTYLAEHMPEPPPLVELDSAALVQEYRLRREQPLPEEPASEAPASEEPASEAPASEEPASEEPASEEPASEEPATLPDHWWLDSPTTLKAEAQSVEGASQSR